METLTRLVTESLARHGFDRPLDYRRLQWSRWVRCESHHSLLVVPSKPGVFALAEEVMDLGSGRENHESIEKQQAHDVTRALEPASTAAQNFPVETRCKKPDTDSRRMLAVTQFFEDDDMAFVLDRMLSRNHPMRPRLESGRYFVRFVEIKDQAQRRSICHALNQWVASSAETATGIGSNFATSPSAAMGAEPTHVGTAAEGRPEPVRRGSSTALSDANHSHVDEVLRNPQQSPEVQPASAPRLNSAVATTIHCSSSFPSGF